MQSITTSVTITDPTGTAYVIEVYGLGATKTYSDVLEFFDRADIDYFVKPSVPSHSYLSNKYHVEEPEENCDEKEAPTSSLDKLFEEITMAHSPELMINSDIIYHIYHEATITHQSGPSSKLKKGESTIERGFIICNAKKKLDYSRFPKTRAGDTGYAIVTFEDAKRIRKMMCDYWDSLENSDSE